MATLQYRPDIDGLRAIAVLLVLAFHLDIGLFSGGYIGVDVFFVISGYLITKLIVDENHLGVFSLKYFYFRRLRRLFPAFAFTLLAVYFFSYWLLSPEHTLNTAWATQASLLFGVNVWFWTDSGYFSTAANFKPLLHFWSLSMEEQFYFIWPASLVLLTKFARRGGVQVFLLLAACASLYWCEKTLKQDPDAAFFLTQYRIYEFAIGALLVWMENKSWQKHMLVCDVVFLVSASALLYTSTNFSQQTTFPGTNALIPTLAAAGIILSAQHSHFKGLISNKPMVGIGLLSYSLYLIHWPLIVFYSYLDFSPLTTPDKLVIAVASIIAAWMMYRFIELPTKQATPGKSFVLACCMAGVILALVGASATATDGWKWRVPETIRKQIESSQNLATARNTMVRAGQCDLTGIAIQQYDERECLGIAPDKRNLLVIGDSHAADIYMTLVFAFPEIHFLQATAPGCRPLLGENYDECGDFIDKLFRDFVFREGIDGIIIAGNWDADSLDKLDETVDYLQRTNQPIILVGPGVSFKPDIATLIASRGTLDDINRIAFRFINPDTEKMERILDIRYGNKMTVLKRSSIQCAVVCDVVDADGHLYYRDGSHLSVEGARYFAPSIVKKYAFAFTR